MRALWLALSLLVQVGWAAEWRTGQAARAVFGQSSFSARDPGVNPVALAVANGKLFVADTARKVISYDLQRQGDGACLACVTLRSALAEQNVPAAGARFATYGQAVAIADPSGQRILLWRNARNFNPDIILADGGLAGEFNPISVALDARYLYAGDGANHRVLIWSLTALSNGRTPQAILGGSDTTPGAANVSTPAALASDGVNLYVADAGNHRVLMFTPESTALGSQSVLHSATLTSGSLAPGTLITIRGEHLASITEAAADDAPNGLPTALANEEVVVDGRAIPLLSVSPSEIRGQLPYTLVYASSVSLYVRGAVTTNAVSLRLSSASPGIFALAGEHEPRPGLLLDGDHPVTREDPVRGGDVVVIWAAGLGLTSSPDDSQPVAGVPLAGEAEPVRTPVSMEVNGAPVEILSAVLPSAAVGIYEIRARMPQQLPAAAALRLQLFQSGAASNVVTFPSSEVSNSTIPN